MAIKRGQARSTEKVETWAVSLFTVKENWRHRPIDRNGATKNWRHRHFLRGQCGGARSAALFASRAVSVWRCLESRGSSSRALPVSRLRTLCHAQHVLKGTRQSPICLVSTTTQRSRRRSGRRVASTLPGRRSLLFRQLLHHHRIQHHRLHHLHRENPRSGSSPRRNG